MKSAPSNKQRGPVKLDKSGQPTTNKTANPQRAEVNQARGPQSGNAGTPSKQKSFLEEKSDRNSRFSQLADMVMSGFGKRGQGMKPHLEDALEPISANTNVGRRRSK
jgi:hypothetical protein